MTWQYMLTTNTIWASFDFGTVEADTREEAEVKAKEEVKYNLDKCNEVLSASENTKGFTISVDLEQIELIPLK